MLANQFIDRLERLGLLDQEIIAALRQQLAEGGSRVTPEAVAKLLVDNGQLTHFQATKLIGELRSGEYNQPASDSGDDLALAVDEAVDVAEPVAAVEAEPLVPVAAVEEVAAVEVDPVVSDQPPAARPAPSRKKPNPEKSVWDSFKIYGYLGIIAMLLLVGGGIAWVLTRENADEVISHADTLYDQQNYEAAQQAYLDFAEDFPDSQHASKANVRVVMTELYKAAEFKQEPWRAVDLAKQKLPAIAEEPGMNDDRGNLGQLLVDIAASVASAAGKAQQTEQKQSLLEKLDQQFALMQNPLYMTSTMRKNLANQIQSVEEDRKRVQREIDRNVQLDKSEAEMKSLLGEQKTKAAYDVRKRLLRDFPDLESNQRLVTLIHQASDIQQTLVTRSDKLPSTLTEAQPSTSLSTIVLTTLVGKPAPDMNGETVYLRAGGSVLAFDGETGKLKWRNFVGYAKDLPPIRLSGEDGVLLSDSAALEVIRCRSDDGQVEWRSQIGEPFSQPVSAADEVFVATDSGRLILIDAVSGDAKWAIQIPQKLATGPGVDRRAERAYLPGDHSNLYLLNSRDGSCLQSYYVGHAEGTIAVPPVPLMGHLFVIENVGSDYCTIHVLKVDDTGGDLQVAQPPFRLTGNVQITPVVQGRRLVVLTDRGEAVVYDVEPTAAKDQVTEAARLAPFYDSPTSTQMAVGKTQMWITGTRMGRYELQINTESIVRVWGLHDGDTFIGQPFAKDDSLIHARVLRGTSAIRVTACDNKSGDEIWHTDVGVPISMLRPAPAGKGVHVVTSQAALFELGREELSSGSTKGPIENPGDRIVDKKYVHPIQIDETRVVMVNQNDGNSILVYDPNRERELLRPVTLNLSAGRPSGGALAAADGVVLPLDNGRVELIDYRTGISKSAPFQPASDPTGKVVWTNPVALPDDPTQVVLANDQKKLYRLRIAEQIRELAAKDLTEVTLGKAAGVGGTWVSATSGPSADTLFGMDMASLEEQFKQLLDGRIVWGPVTAGDVGLIQTDDGQLRGFSATGTPRFAVPLPAGKPVGQPVLVDGNIVLAGQPGWLVSISPSTGQIVGQSDLQQPISATPFPIGSSLLVPGQEGVIYIVRVPAE